MNRELIKVSLLQTLRSVIVFLLPLAFICLMAWATAGNSTGNTSDPIRAAAWLWIGAHHIPFVLQITGNNSLITSLGGTGSFFSYLPLGALIFPYLTIRTGFRRALGKFDQPNPMLKRRLVLIFSLVYGFLATIIGLLSSNNQVGIRWYWVFPITFLIAASTTFFTSDLLPIRIGLLPWQRGVRSAWVSLLFFIGFGSLALSISLFIHFSTVKDLTTIIQPGIFGGISLVLLQILYLPNLAVAAISYFIGAGFYLGDGSFVNPLIHRLEEIPAIPLLGSLPVNTFPLALTGMFLPIILGALLLRYASSRYNDEISRKRYLLSFLGSFAGLFALIAFLASGALLTDALSLVGLSWWRAAGVLLLETSAGMVLGYLFSYLTRKMKEKRNVKKNGNRNQSKRTPSS